MKSYQFYVHDYLRDTVGISDLEDLIYRRFLDWYHMNERPLPKNLTACAKIAGMHPANEVHMRCVQSVLDGFFFMVDGFGWAHEVAQNNVSRFNDWKISKKIERERFETNNQSAADVGNGFMARQQEREKLNPDVTAEHRVLH